MTEYVIRLLRSDEAPAYRDALIDLLVDAVEGGASVNFVWPMTREKSARWWDRALGDIATGERRIFVAERNGGVDGTVQLILAPQENQPHRADIAKMLVHRRARRQGLGKALLDAAESHAREIGRTLLTLDTESGSDGERFYARMGWIKFGEVPSYARHADDPVPVPASFFYKVL
ncbi:acetyltransferase (GNAT) family protein [Dongia mobilis]|uniref:Acetyltransferase (GNAT) family protein n=1 Tax=Dongia mobilis TaxID=578943 RepID=A0A4R6WQ71_9PROT|nr:GNAT family N-acetyltransferase [Dongia mobilis]TDQ81400.1 acetyltransferase (GNAT) family protein [Dongia mobilis]